VPLVVWILPWGAHHLLVLSDASIGRSCIRFERLADVDQEVLERLLRYVAGAGAPGA
jgi:hypothetical protein